MVPGSDTLEESLVVVEVTEQVVQVPAFGVGQFATDRRVDVTVPRFAPESAGTSPAGSTLPGGASGA